MSGCLSIQFGGNAVRFTTDSQAVLDALAIHLRHCLAEAAPALADFQITAITGTVFRVAVDGGVLYPRLAFGQVLQVLMQEALARLNGARFRPGVSRRGAGRCAGRGHPVRAERQRQIHAGGLDVGLARLSLPD